MRLSEARFLIAAAVLHLAIPVAAEIAPEPRTIGTLLASATRQHVEVEVDVSGLEIPPEARFDPDLPHAGPPRMAYHGERRYDPRRPFRVPAPDDTSEPLTEPPGDGATELLPDPGGEPGDDEYLRPPSRADVDGRRGVPGLPGLGGKTAWQYPGGIPPDDRGSRPAPTKAPRRTYDPERGNEVLRSGVRAKDAKLALHFPGGPTIKNAAVAAVRDSDAPYVSSGSFTVSVNGQGKITKVVLLGYSGGGSATWQAIKKSIQARLAGRTLPLKSDFAKGAVVSVAVRSDQKMPGGGTSREGTTLSFDVTDIDARPVRVVVGSWHATPVK